MNLSFKNKVVEEVELYVFAKRKGELIGDSGYIKTLLKKEFEKEKKENRNE